MDVVQRDRRYLAREQAAEIVQFVRSESSFLFDQRGKKYVDFTAGWCVGNLGWGNEEIRAAVREFDGPTYIHPDYLYREWAELAEGLAEIAPGKLTKCYRATGGSEAVEIALQVAMAATGRPGFVSLAGCYHGNTIGGRSLAGDRETYPNLLPHCRHLKPLLPW
jgi:4-aminobutyrate aminotransferase-like enzyme